MPRRRPTIADVARAAGVSPAAVSFAVNDRPGVSEETRERIIAIARDLGWTPSASARALTEARTRAIGLVLARDLEQLELDSFFVRFLSGLERALSPADYALLLQLVPSGGAPALHAHERLAAAGRVDGFLLTDIEVDDARIALLEATGSPVVLAGRPVGPCAFPWVETRHEEGMDAVVRHLVELGHERIGFLSGPLTLEHLQVRRSHWAAAMRAAGLTDSAVLRSPEDVFEAGVTAVACTSDLLAMSVVSAARERGVSVPGQLSVTGFDDSPLAALASPALTSVRVDYAEFGAAAGAALLAVIGGEEPAAYSGSPPELVLRASTARLRRQTT